MITTTPASVSTAAISGARCQFTNTTPAAPTKHSALIRYDSAKFQDLFKSSEVTLDDKARREAYLKMQHLLVEDAPVVWLYMHPRLAVAKKGVQGLWKDLPTPAADLSEVAVTK